MVPLQWPLLPISLEHEDQFWSAAKEPDWAPVGRHERLLTGSKLILETAAVVGNANARAGVLINEVWDTRDEVCSIRVSYDRSRSVDDLDHRSALDTAMQEVVEGCG